MSPHKRATGNGLGREPHLRNDTFSAKSSRRERQKIARGVSPRKPRAQNFSTSPRRGRHIGRPPSGSSSHTPGHDIRGYTNVVLRFIGLLTRCAARWRGLGDNWGPRFLGFRCRSTPGYSLSPAAAGSVRNEVRSPMGFARASPQAIFCRPSSRALCGMRFGLQMGSAWVPLPLHPRLSSVALFEGSLRNDVRPPRGLRSTLGFSPSSARGGLSDFSDRLTHPSSLWNH